MESPGLRGVGKTVLLNAFETLALERCCVVIKHEAVKQPEGFSRKFPSLARRALLEISPADRWRDRGRRAAAILRGFKAKFDPDGEDSATEEVATEEAAPAVEAEAPSAPAAEAEAPAAE
jgi:hypothetical protein